MLTSIETPFEVNGRLVAGAIDNNVGVVNIVYDQPDALNFSPKTEGLSMLMALRTNVKMPAAVVTVTKLQQPESAQYVKPSENLL
jgi:hypothetical protein